MRTWVVPIGLAAVLLAGAATAQSQTSQLHDALHLSAAQEEPWRTYQRSLAPTGDDESRARQTAMLLPTLPTPRRLALMRAQMQADLAAFDRRAAAVEAFYAALTPDQQRAFDRQTAAAAVQPPPRGPTRPLPGG